ncbi:MAG: RNA methyltransferase [Duodenibacillus sp.]|nr:RNA methyltransferase [Duodenibacillus sp.]
MRTTVITSEANALVKRWRQLAQNPRACKKAGLTLAEGEHLAQAALAAGAEVRAVALRQDGASAEAVKLARAVCEALGAPLFVVANPLYEAASPVERGAGVMLEIAVPQPGLPASPVDADALYLDGVQDAGNAGTLIRTAVAAGVRWIAASPATAGLWSPKVMRAAMGAHFGARIVENVPPGRLPELFAGRRLAADARGGEDLWRARGWERGSTVWLMGAEGPGLSEAALAVAEARYLVDIEPACESLNVAAAAAVCLFEQRRRRRAA